jgi:hypothetical protein
MNHVQQINEALDMHRGPQDWLSCEEIAAKLNLPLEMIHAVVEQRWNAIIGGAA